MATVHSVGVAMVIPDSWDEGPAKTMIEEFNKEVERLKLAMLDFHPDVSFKHTTTMSRV